LGVFGLPIWLIIIIIGFIGNSIICENFFVPAVEDLASSLNMSDDVAGMVCNLGSYPLLIVVRTGATLLAIASSSSEFFTALCGLLRPQREDPGPGVVVGSAFFNSTLMIAASALAVRWPFRNCSPAEEAVPELKAWPVVRNSTFCILSIILLLVFYSVITPNEIDMYVRFRLHFDAFTGFNRFEALILVGMYVVYALLLTYDKAIRTTLCKYITPGAEWGKEDLELVELTDEPVVV
jgi:Ca2+/Na+ antiporter